MDAVPYLVTTLPNDVITSHSLTQEHKDRPKRHADGSNDFWTVVDAWSIGASDRKLSGKGVTPRLLEDR